MSPGAMFGILIVAIVVIGILAAVMRAGYEKTLRALAGPLGLNYQRLGAPVGTGHSIQGALDGRPFSLMIVPEGRGRNAVLAESWQIQLAGALPGGFAASKNGWTQSVSKGMFRVPSNDPAFDKLVLCEAVNPDEARIVIDGGPRSAALRDLATMKAIIFDGKVMLHKSGFDNNLATLRNRLERLRAIARCIDPIQPVVQPMPPQPQFQPPPPG